MLTIRLFLILFLLFGFSSLFAEGVETESEYLLKEKIDLKLPLLVIKNSRGFLACAYVDVDTCNKTGEACAIVSGVNTHDDMLKARVKHISSAASALGIRIGMTGSEALNLMH